MRCLLALPLLALLTGCGGAPAAADDPGLRANLLEGTSWRLQHVRKSAVPEDVVITATFADGRVTGAAGCNSYFADARLGDGTLEVGPVGATKRLCPEPVMAWEDEYLGYLEAAERWQRLDDGRLQIFAGHEALTFVPDPAPDR